VYTSRETVISLPEQGRKKETDKDSLVVHEAQSQSPHQAVRCEYPTVRYCELPTGAQLLSHGTSWWPLVAGLACFLKSSFLLALKQVLLFFKNTNQ